MDAQIESGINDHLRSSWARGKITEFFSQESKDKEVELNRKRFISQLNLKNDNVFVNQNIQQILQNTLLVGSDDDKIRIAKKFVERIQRAISNLPPEDYTVPELPSQDLDTTISGDAGLNTSVVEEIGVRKGGRKTRKQDKKLLKKTRRKIKLREDRPVFAEELDGPIAGGKKHRK
jgi:hypothetical protein